MALKKSLQSSKQNSIKLFGSTFAFVLIVFILGACGKNLHGEVYLDLNANNQREEDTNVEPFIANLPFTVTKDGIEIASGTTKNDGSFEVELDGPGNYCVEVTEGNLTSINADGSEPSLVAGLVSNIKPLNLKKQVIGSLPDSQESDSDTTDDDDATDDTDSGTDETSDTTNSSTESGYVCADSSGNNLELNVPVAKNYTSGISSLENPAEKTVSRGDSLNLAIQYPSSCTFDLIYLPLSVTPTGASDTIYDSVTGLYDFNKAIEAATPTVSQALAIHHETLSTYTLALTINQDGSLQNKNLTITPTVNCPDSETLSLKTHTININSDNDFEVTQSLSGSVALSSTLTVTTTVTNNTTLDFDSEDLELRIQTPVYTQDQSYDSACRNNGNYAICEFSLAAESSRTFTTTFSMPDSLLDDTTFDSTATLSVQSEGESVDFIADPITFSLEGSGDGS